MPFASFWEDSDTCFTSDTGGKLCNAIALGTISGLLLLLAHRCRYQLESGREATTSLYCLLGNICSTIGAILSRQQNGYGDQDRIKRARRRRRRQHLFELCVLMMVTGGFLKVGLSNFEMDKTPIRRRLLQAIMENNSDVLGYVLGILSFVIAYTSKFPSFYRYTKRLTRAQVFSSVLCSLAAVCYASALLLYDSSYAFIWRALPWLLSAVLCAIMDLLVSFQRKSFQDHVVFSQDTERLLGETAITFKEGADIEKIHSSPHIKVITFLLQSFKTLYQVHLVVDLFTSTF
uniref:Transmembrane protein 44 n=1 Tax=Neogobius melanostomus TaxID=47308 RepID=A0A8C6WFP5_9GOBI